MQTVKMGDVVKSLDFPGTNDCYMIGKVVAIFDDMYNCKAIVQVWEGKAEIVSNVYDFAVPCEGHHFLDEKFPGRITVIA